MSDRIKLFQLDRLWKEVHLDLTRLAAAEMKKGFAQKGPFVEKLENRIAEYFDRKHCITTASCTDALYIGVTALGLPSHSRIAVNNYTFVASAHAIRKAGHIPVPIDIDDRYSMNIELINNCDAAIVVDLFGNMSPLPYIPTIVDAAQSFESMEDCITSANRGKIACVSFSPTKTISSWGSGGAILTDDDDIAEKCYRLRLHGKLKNSDDAIEAGSNSMISVFEAAAIWTGMNKMHRWRDRRDLIARYIAKESSYECGIDLSQDRHTHSKLVFTSKDAPAIIKKLNDENIEACLTYSRLISEETLYKNNNDYPNSVRLRNTTFTVPNQHTLTDDEVERIAKALK
jgi:dTDP-4-amino-4,6-dideoxygalactose transaminase